MVSTSIETELLGMGLARGQLMMQCTVTYEQMSAEFGVSTKIGIPKAVSISVETGLLVVGVVQGRLMARRRISLTFYIALFEATLSTPTLFVDASARFVAEPSLDAHGTLSSNTGKCGSGHENSVMSSRHSGMRV